MTYSALLAIHLLGAAATGIVSASAGAALWHAQSAKYQPHVITLGFLAGFEILSGVALAVASADVTAASLCQNVALYLSGVFTVEGLLFLGMRNVAITFPLRYALSPTFASLVVMVTAIGIGF